MYHLFNSSSHILGRRDKYCLCSILNQKKLSVELFDILCSDFYHFFVKVCQNRERTGIL